MMTADHPYDVVVTAVGLQFNPNTRSTYGVRVFYFYVFG